MSKQLLHTPEGARDIYNGECEEKLFLQEKLQSAMKSYGYHNIETPTIEYFDVFSKEIGTISSNELYKFFDREGNTLVLRPDITPSIARACSTVFADTLVPVRLCYTGNTFINHSSYRGRLREVTQMGAELIGDSTADADAEIIAMTIDCLKASGLKEFQVSVGQMDFFRSLIEEADMDQETEERLRDLIVNKNIFGVEELVQEQNLPDTLKEVFFRLPELFGGPEILLEAKNMAVNARGREAIRRLAEIYNILRVYKMDSYLSFDLGMLGNYEYYTGVTIRAYTYGTGDYVITGGRYDNLLNKFGKDSPAIGFAIEVDELMNALNRQRIPLTRGNEGVLMVYDEEVRSQAIKIARQLRGGNRSVELMPRNKDLEMEAYADYAKNSRMTSLIYLDVSRRVTMKELDSGDSKTFSLEDLSGKENK